MKKTTFLLLSALALVTVGNAQQVTTFSGQAGTPGTTQSTSSAALAAATYDGPGNLTYDAASGRVWIVESGGNRLRMIDQIATPSTANVYNRAGSPAGTGGANDNSGINARFNVPSGVVTDAAGNIYIADLFNNTIRKVTPFSSVGNVQTVSTFAGFEGVGTFADGTGANARFNVPSDLAIDGSGNIYVADAANNRIRKITSAGVVTTLAGNGTFGSLDGNDTFATFSAPTGLGWLNSTDLLVADWAGHKIRKVNVVTGAVTTVAGTGSNGDVDGNVSSATLSFPVDVAVDNNGYIYVTTKAHTIRRIIGTCVSTFAGSATVAGSTDATGANARFTGPTGIIFVPGTTPYLYVCDQDNHTIRRINIGTVTDPTAKPVSAFTASSTWASQNVAITITDTSTNAPNNWLWNITPPTFTVTSGSLTSATFDVTFQDIGLYSIELIAGNCYGTDTVLKTDYINVLATGLKEAGAAMRAEIYPNPTAGRFGIRLNSTVATTINVLDLNGRLILSKQASSDIENIDMTSFSKGIYIVNISSEKGIATRKLVVN